MEGSVLDEEFVNSLGKFDLVWLVGGSASYRKFKGYYKFLLISKKWRLYFLGIISANIFRLFLAN